MVHFKSVRTNLVIGYITHNVERKQEGMIVKYLIAQVIF